MTTIPARLAQRTIISKNFAEAQARSRALYRDWYKSAPEIASLYALNVPPSTLRAKFRTWFERNRNVKDLAVIDLMLFKSRNELQETLNAWKQIPHIMNWFQEEEVSSLLDALSLEVGTDNSICFVLIILYPRQHVSLILFMTKSRSLVSVEHPMLTRYLPPTCTPYSYTRDVLGEILRIQRRRQRNHKIRNVSEWARQNLNMVIMCTASHSQTITYT